LGDVASNIYFFRAATSQDAMCPTKREFKMRWMTWRAHRMPCASTTRVQNALDDVAGTALSAGPCLGRVRGVIHAVVTQVEFESSI